LAGPARAATIALRPPSVHPTPEERRVSDEQPKKRRFPRIASEHVALVRATGA
jgi:hypothetical protein